MKIEVACKKESSNKEKGGLLERLSKKLLEAQGYNVIEEIRIVGAELDLLCEHKVNKKVIYVECKAQKDPISSPVLRQLWGTVDCEDYSEGWLISTSEFTKDAKGFVESWKSKPKEKSSRLSFYSPNIVIDSLQDASIIKSPPVSSAESVIDAEFIGEWTLLITQYGMFWCVYTLNGGAPYGVLVYSASNGRQIQDETTLGNLATLETELTWTPTLTIDNPPKQIHHQSPQGTPLVKGVNHAQAPLCPGLTGVHTLLPLCLPLCSPGFSLWERSNFRQ